MALIIDLSQLAVAAYVKAPVSQSELTKDLTKHLIINSIRTNVLKFKNQPGCQEVVLACDGRNTWRNGKFAYYKAKRKEKRASGDGPINWSLLFETLKELKTEIKEHFPYKILDVEGAEGDDVVAAVVKNTPGPHLIIGSDKDYVQLHSIEGVRQFCPKTKKFITVDNPDHQLQELIICGDESDGIPNIKSDDDTFVCTDKRQAPIQKARLKEWMTLRPEFFCENSKMLRNYGRNQELIDFNYIPKEVIDNVLEAYAVPVNGSRRTLMAYFTQHKMRNLLSCIGDF